MKWKENLYPQQAKSIFEYSMEQAKISADENEWYTKHGFSHCHIDICGVKWQNVIGLSYVTGVYKKWEKEIIKPVYWHSGYGWHCLSWGSVYRQM